jgi:hypothetical protein
LKPITAIVWTGSGPPLHRADDRRMSLTSGKWREKSALMSALI